MQIVHWLKWILMLIHPFQATPHPRFSSFSVTGISLPEPDHMILLYTERIAQGKF